jgi:branched-chain amino acid transport system substrate-binding protein
MYFPQLSIADEIIYATVASGAEQLVPKGKVKWASMYCAEATICEIGDRVTSASAKSLGYEVVYRGRNSLAQPDFTAECLAARNAGAEVMVMGEDTNSMGRIAASCARQGFRPLYVLFGQGIVPAMAKDPNLANAIGPSYTFPWFQSGTPATDEFQAAMRKYSKGSVTGGHPIGWVAGKILEKAAVALPEPPTSESILQGLWSIKDDTLGGLSMPLTFVRDQVTKPKACWINIESRSGAWINTDGYRLKCRDR